MNKILMKSMISFFAYARSEVSGHSEVSGPSGGLGLYYRQLDLYCELLDCWTPPPVPPACRRMTV